MKEAMVEPTELIQMLENRNAPASGIAGLMLLSLINGGASACCCCNCNCNCCCIA